MNKSLFLCILALISYALNFVQVYAQKFPIEDRSKTQQIYLEVYPLIYHDKIESDDRKFLEQLQKKSNYEKEIQPAIDLFDLHLPKQLFKSYIFWRYLTPDTKKSELILSFILFQKILILRDFADSPYNQSKKSALKELRRVSGHNSLQTQNIFKEYYPLIQQKSKLISKIKDNKLFLEALSSTNLFTYKTNKQKGISPYVISYLGFIPGNKVELLSKNEVDQNRIQWIKEKGLKADQNIDFTLEHLKMPKRFTSEGNPIFENDPIFIKIKDMIKQANDSIFIDIFLLGGTLGATLSKYLIDQTKLKVKENPKFKVIILHDFASHKNLMSEMKPVFKYIKSRISTEKELKDNLILLQANIQRHPSGTPFGLGYKPKVTAKLIKNLEKDPNHFQSKFDHSKVLVIDGNTQRPAAYFGSKNWSDSSGAFFYDDSIYVEGPAAALVQSAYYRDIKAALTEREEELEWFYYKKEGFNNEDYHNKKKVILDSFAITSKTIPYQGQSILRLAETDIDSKIVNTRHLLVDMIIKAEKKIYLEHLYFYDKYIVDALIKKKIEKPKIDIRVILDPNQDLELGGLPNTIFLEEIVSSGIQVRSRITGKGKKLITSAITGKPLRALNHRKIISIDSKVLMTGSSDITPNALQGSSREFGAQVFNPKIAKKFENRFTKDWNDPNKLVIMDIENFRARLDGKTLSKENSNLINKILSLLLRSKDELEGR